MQTTTLYRYTRSDGGVTVSPEQPDEGTAYAWEPGVYGWTEVTASN